MFVRIFDSIYVSAPPFCGDPRIFIRSPRFIRSASFRVMSDGDKSHVVEAEDDIGMATMFQFKTAVSFQSPKQYEAALSLYPLSLFLH